MLLRIDASDMLNTTLIDTTTGEVAFTVTTTLDSRKISGSSDSPGAGPSSPGPEVLVKTKETPTSNSVSWPIIRRTEIRDHDGVLLADITWNGRRPDITFGEEHVGALTNLFDTTTVKIVSKAALALPTRFDNEFVWTATASSLTLVDCRSNETKGIFHHNALRIPNSNTLSPPSSPSTDRFINMHVPGFGHNYLEFDSIPLARDIEIIVSFFMMEILRRGRFSLTPYTFERSKLWQLIEAKDLIMRRLRRSTL